jgi:hypothetical protein
MGVYWETEDGTLRPGAPMWAKEGNASKWQDWFAWYPVSCAAPGEAFHKWVWLRTVQRRRFYCAVWFCIPYFDEYRRKP